jgi:hypothetical protein
MKKIQRKRPPMMPRMVFGGPNSSWRPGEEGGEGLAVSEVEDRRGLAHRSSLSGWPVWSSSELAILMGRPMGVSYSLVQSMPKAL